MHFSKPKDLEKIRRIALNSQGLIGSAPFGMGLGGAEAAIHHLSYIQLDGISVIERAHNHLHQVVHVDVHCSFDEKKAFNAKS